MTFLIQLAMIESFKLYKQLSGQHYNSKVQDQQTFTNNLFVDSFVIFSTTLNILDSDHASTSSQAGGKKTGTYMDRTCFIYLNNLCTFDNF